MANVPADRRKLAAQEIRDGKKGIIATAKELGVSERTVREWVREYRLELEAKARAMEIGKEPQEAPPPKETPKPKEETVEPKKKQAPKKRKEEVEEEEVEEVEEEESKEAPPKRKPAKSREEDSDGEPDTSKVEEDDDTWDY